MSWRASGITKGIKKGEGITRSEKFLLLILSDYYNEETGRCDPSVPRLADEAFISERQAVRLLQDLERKGFIAIRHRTATSNQYDLLYLSTRRGDMLAPPNRDKPVSEMSPKPSVTVIDEPHSVASPPPKAPALPGMEVTEKPAIDRFYEATSQGQQVAALIDLARAQGRDLNGGRLAGILMRHKGQGPEAIISALNRALARRPAVVEDWMEKLLQGSNGEQGAGRSRRRAVASDAGSPDDIRRDF